MTPTLSRQFFETFPPDVARGFLAGDRLRIHAAKVSVVREAGTTGFAIDTLPVAGRPAEWERTTQKICKILKREVERLPVETKRLLATFAYILPGEPILLFQVETWLSMKDDGGSWWEVPAYLSLAAISLPAVVKASEQAKKRILKVVTAI
jgi:hypothetical protein